MTGMSLVSSYQGGGPKRKETESTIELDSSPKDSILSWQMQQQGSSQPPPTANQSVKDSPPSPNDVDKQQSSVSKGITGRPPGLGGASVPSPIGMPGHSKNTSATSPLLTLTPNSSVDGNSDWHSLGTRHSPTLQSGDGPSLPFLQAEVRGHGVNDDGAASFGSFDLHANDNDGLLGLEALRDRANSSPGPAMSASAPVIRGHFPAHGSVNSLSGDGPSDKSRPRARPPLSQQPHQQEGMSSHQGDRSGLGTSFASSNRSVGSDSGNNASIDSADSRGFGAIGRTELRQSASDFDINRRRATSSDNYQNPYALQPPSDVMGQSLQSKFGTLPTLGAHVQQQRHHDMPADLQRPRHVRSASQPMPNDSNGLPPVGMDARFYQNAMQQEGHSYSGESKYSRNQGSMSQPALGSLYDQNQGAFNSKRVSMPNLGGVQAYGQYGSYPGLSRRDALDYQLSPHTQLSGNTEDMRSFGTAGMISPAHTPGHTPGHSPMQMHYGGSGHHGRHMSESGSAMLSSSPRSFPGLSRGVTTGGMMHQRHHTAGEDDLTHPLVGEHIDVPNDEDAFSMPNPYGIPHSMQRQNQSLPPQFIETSHHLPTAGAALPMPKVVYCVKFKRTQRNFVLGPRISRDLKIGTYVKVEADRGEDLGIVVGKIPAEKYNFSNSRSSFTAGLGPQPGIGGSAADLKRIIRLATHDEVGLLAMKRDEEEELLRICRTKVRQRGLPMHVVDAEYQFDRHKLTFFFEAEGRVDFRELVRDLFSMYKTRIWMQQLDKNTSTSAPAIIAPNPSNLQMDYGTPIIAPMSEFADSVVLGGMLPGER